MSFFADDPVLEMPRGPDLFEFEGDTLTDFAQALLVGIGVGTWSSLFVAASLLVAFEGRSSRPRTTVPRPRTGSRT